MILFIALFFSSTVLSLSNPSSTSHPSSHSSPNPSPFIHPLLPPLHTLSFTVNVCASYTGRGLSGPLGKVDIIFSHMTCLHFNLHVPIGVSFVVREVLDAQTKRLFFGTPAGKLDSYVGLFQFQSNGSVYCYSVVSYIDVSLIVIPPGTQ